MKPINEIINTCLHTCLLDSKYPPVSMLLVAPSGGGKSLSLIRYRAPWIHHTNDITSGGLFDLLERDHESKIRAIVLPDFNLPLSHKGSVVSLTMGNLLSIMSEGTARIDDGRKVKELAHRPVSILSAVTPEMAMIHHRKWRQLGIIRRFLTVRYCYSIATELEGMRLIREEKITGSLLPHRDISFKGDNVNPPIASEAMMAEVEAHAVRLSQQLGVIPVRDFKTHKVSWKKAEAVLTFSPFVTLKSMVKAHAVSCGRAKVTREDIEFLGTLLRFTDPSRPGDI